MELKKLISELDEIIEKFNDDVEIDEAIKLYEKGITLSKEIKKCLLEAKNKIEVINNKQD